jgi:hypothetical protein
MAMKRASLKGILRAAIVTAAIVFFAGVSSASLMLRKPSIDIFAGQGDISYGEVILDNVSDKPLHIKASFAGDTDCSSWVRLESEEFVIPAGSSRSLKIIADVPYDVSGDHSTAVVYSYQAGQMQGPDDLILNIKMHIEMAVNVHVAGAFQAAN